MSALDPDPRTIDLQAADVAWKWYMYSVPVSASKSMPCAKFATNPVGPTTVIAPLVGLIRTRLLGMVPPPNW